MKRRTLSNLINKQILKRKEVILIKYPWSNISGFPELDFGYLKFKLYWASSFNDGFRKYTFHIYTSTTRWETTRILESFKVKDVMEAIEKAEELIQDKIIPELQSHF